MPAGQWVMGCFLRFEKVEVRYQMPKKFGFRGALFVSLLCEVRLHLSIAFESKLSSLCIRFALTLHQLIKQDYIKLIDEKTNFPV